MFKEYANELRKRFEARLKKEFPQFRSKKKDDNLAAGNRLYQCIIADNVHLYILLGIHDNSEEFTVDVAHSTTNSLPIEDAFYRPIEGQIEGDVCFRLSSFWSSKDDWWVIEKIPLEKMAQVLIARDFKPLPPEQFVPRIEQLLDDVMDKLQKYAVPWFEKIAAQHGYCINTNT
jgi:hypothetical protein